MHWIVYYGVGHPESLSRARAVWDEMRSLRELDIGFCYVGEAATDDHRGNWKVASPPVDIQQSPKALHLWFAKVISTFDGIPFTIVADSFPMGFQNELNLRAKQVSSAVWLATHLSGTWANHLKLMRDSRAQGDILWCEYGPPPAWLVEIAVRRGVEVNSTGPVHSFDGSRLLSRTLARKQMALKDGDFAVSCACYPSAEHRRRLSNLVRQLADVWRQDRKASRPADAQFRFFLTSVDSKLGIESDYFRAYDLFLGHFDYEYAYHVCQLQTPSVGFLEANVATGPRERLISLGYLRRPLQRVADTEHACVKEFRELLSSTTATRHSSVVGALASQPMGLSRSSRPRYHGAERVAAYLQQRIEAAQLP